MKKTLLSCLCCSLLMMSMLHAQSWKLESAKLAYEKENYGEAIETLKEALPNAEDLKGKKRVELHYWLAMSYIKAAEKMPEQYPGAAELGFRQMKKAIRLDEKMGTGYDRKIEDGKFYLYNAIYEAGDRAYQQADYKTAISNYLKATELRPDEYAPYLILGYAHYFTADTSAAMSNWSRAIDLHALNTGAPDSSMIGVYLHQIDLLLNYKRDIRKAQRLVLQARQIFPYDQDLQTAELVIYQSEPALAQKALEKFASALAKDSSNLNLQLTYAGLLEMQARNQEALSIYRSVVARDSNHYLANANLGVYHINQAYDLLNRYNVADASGNEVLADTLKSQTQSQLERAYPFIKKVHAIKPNEEKWIQQLYVICANLDRKEEMQKYEALLEEEEEEENE